MQSLTGFRRTPADRTRQRLRIGDIDAAQPVTPAAGDTALAHFKIGRLQLRQSRASTSLGTAMSGTALDLNKVTADMLDARGPNQRYTFTHMLGSPTLEVKRRDPGGKLLTGPGKNPFSKRLVGDPPWPRQPDAEEAAQLEVIGLDALGRQRLGL